MEADRGGGGGGGGAGRGADRSHLRHAGGGRRRSSWNAETLDAPNTGDASNRTFFRGDGSWAGVGVQDAAHALLTSAMSTMSSTYQTILSASVTSSAAGDRAIVHVSGQIGWMGANLFIVDDDGDELWSVGDPTIPTSAVLEGDFPSGLTTPQGITSHGGSLYIVDNDGDELWRLDDPTDPGSAVLEGDFPSGLATPRGITSHGGSLYVIGFGFDDELWRLDDPTDPGSAVSEGDFPSGFFAPFGITSHGGSLYIVDDVALWRLDDPTDPGSVVSQGNFPSGLQPPSGITSHGGSLYIVNDNGLWRLDPTDPGSAVLEGNFPSGLTDPQGITSLGEAPCDIRVARGNTDVAVFTLSEGMILFDTTVTDAPPAGTHVYSFQMKTSNPNTLCTASLGRGVFPVPSLFVEMFYGGA